MKKYILFIIGALTIMTAFTACGSGKEEAVETGNIADQILDEKIFNQSINQNDSELCKEISDANKSEECDDIVLASEKTAEAIKSQNESICEDIELPRYVDNCKRGVQNEIKKSQQGVKEKEEYEENGQISLKASEATDPALCEEITSDSQKATCLFNIYIGLASKEGDAEICDKIGDSELIAICKSQIES